MTLQRVTGQKSCQVTMREDSGHRLISEHSLGPPPAPGPVTPDTPRVHNHTLVSRECEVREPDIIFALKVFCCL